MIGGLLVMGGLGAFVGIGLALASKIFYVYVDPKVEAVEEALPGANCGGCGLPGCGANAVAIVQGKASASSCVAGGPDVAAEIAEIMGVKLEAREPDIAKPGCTYGFQDADLRYLYNGVVDCRAAAMLDGGSKVCPIGCLGLGTCVRSCPFGALSMGPDNLPIVDPDLCTGCGTCERVCPKHIITLSSYTRRIQAEYTTDECTAPCQRTCPAGIDIPAYIHQISLGNYLEAVRVIKETNPFPLVCGRICVHPCEFECRRNLVDEPVAINHLKRFASDYEMASGQRVHIPRAPETGRRVAVVGGGAEGLTAAYFLNRMGHDVTLYEGSSRLGGLLRTGLPQNRLPANVLNWEIQGILDAGVQAVTNQELGKDITVDTLLKQGFQSVFVATGGWDAQLTEKETNKKVQPLPGVQLLIDFVLAQRSGDKKKASLGSSVVILEGGSAGLEAARACLKSGVKNVHLVFRSSPMNAPFSEDDLTGSERKKITIHFQSGLTRMSGKGSKLTHVEISNIFATAETTRLSANTLLTGAGRFPELVYVPSGKGQGTEGAPIKGTVSWETLIPSPGPFAEQDVGMFRPGEVVGDYKAVVEAIGAGRRSARSVHRYLYEEPVEAPENMIRKYTEVLNVNELEPVSTAARQRMPELSQEAQVKDPDAEIALGFSEEQAVTESKRCLQCGLICYRRVKGELSG